jgi:hypothetical protein
MCVVGFCGSRYLSPSFRPLVSGVVSSVLVGGCSVAVGCASGADEFVLSSVVSSGAASRLSVFSAFGPGGVGAVRVSAVSSVLSALSAGASVQWWAGGGPRVPVRARLVRRSAAFVSFLASSPGSSPSASLRTSLVGFVSSPVVAGSGAWGEVGLAVRCGVPVVVFPCGFPASALPSLGQGRWVSAGGGVWSGGWRWVPSASQPSLV